MKKCCVPKHFVLRECNKYAKSSGGTNRVKSSIRASSSKHWCTRNNSSNVSAILHPDDCVSVHSDSEDSEHYSKSAVQRKCFLSDNNCYCTGKLVEPTLLPRPRTCIIPDTSMAKPTIRISNRGVSFKVTPCTKLEAPSTKLKKIREEEIKVDETCSEGSCLRYTRDRENYEHVRDLLVEDYLEKIRRYEEEDEDEEEGTDGYLECTCPEAGQSKTASKSSKTRNGHSRSVSRYESSTRTSKHSQGNKSMQQITAEEEDAIREVENVIREDEERHKVGSRENQRQNQLDNGGEENQNDHEQSPSVRSTDKESNQKSDWLDFRKNHYVETHASDSQTPIPDHVCVHKFTLTDRLFPQAINSDAYGTSRCIICDKVMPVEKTVYKDERFDKKLFPKYYKYGLWPVRVNVGAENTKIILSLSEKEAIKLRETPFKLKKPEYTNTYALRFQRGVV